MLTRNVKLIVGIMVACLLFSGVAMAAPGLYANSSAKSSCDPTCKGNSGNDIAGAQGNNCDNVVKKTVFKKRVVKKTFDNGKTKVKEVVVRKVLVRESSTTATALLGSVSGKTFLDKQPVTVSTTNGTSVIETSTPLGRVDLRLFVARTSKWGITQVKTVYIAHSDKNGQYTFVNVVPGSYTLKVWSPVAIPVSDTTLTVTVKQNEVTQVPDIHFVGLASVTGKTLLDQSQTVTSTSGTTTTVQSSSPLADVSLRLFELKKTKWGFNEYRTVYAARSDKNGQYLFKNVKAGSYILKVWSPDAVPVSDTEINVTVKTNEAVSVPDIHLKARTAI